MEPEAEALLIRNAELENYVDHLIEVNRTLRKTRTSELTDQTVIRLLARVKWLERTKEIERKKIEDIEGIIRDWYSDKVTTKSIALDQIDKVVRRHEILSME